MPTYEYECTKCGHRLEAFQYFSEKPLKKCPACSRRTLRRLIGAGSAVIFKGSGFYQTDYRSDSYKTAAKADSDSTQSSPAPSKGKKDTPTSPPKDSGSATPDSRK